MEDARDARRAADVHRDPVLRLGHGRPFPSRTWSRTSSPSTPRAAPRTRACAATRRSSSRRCSTKALALGFDAVCDRPLRADPRSTESLHRAADPGKDQSYVLAVLDQRAARATSMFPLGDSPKARSAPRLRGAGSRSRTSRTATTSASSPTATPGGFLAEQLGAGARPDRRPVRHRPRRARRRLRASPSASAAACASARPPATASPATCSTSSR